jgi:hypothetical protein
MAAAGLLRNESTWDSEIESLIHANPAFEQTEVHDDDKIPTRLIVHGRNGLMAIKNK